MNSLIITVSALLISFGQGSQVEQDVLTKILDKYDIRIRPTADPNEAVKMTIDFYLSKLRNIDESKGFADIAIWVTMGWNDSRLSWKPSDHKDVKKLIIPSTDIWVPDMILYTGDGAVEGSVGASKDYSVTVKPTGELYLVHPVTKILPCVHKNKDKDLVCSFTVGSWTMPEDLMVITTTKNTVDTSLLGTYVDPAYRIKGATYKVEHFVYPDVPDEKWDLVKAVIVLDKKD